MKNSLKKKVLSHIKKDTKEFKNQLQEDRKLKKEIKRKSKH